MFERFTDRARRVLVLAQEEARMLNHHHIGTEHVLLGLIHEDEGAGAKVLVNLGIPLEALRRQVEEIIGLGQQATTAEHIPFTPRAKKVLELSLREALLMKHNYIGTEHILLGLIREGQGGAAQILVKQGADLDGTRQRVIQLLSDFRVKETITALTPAQDTSSRYPILNGFGRNLTHAAHEADLHPVVGRDKEIERVVQILTRRQRNVPLLVGERGVGKEAVVAGLAHAIAAGDVPPILQGRTVQSLDLGAVLTDPQQRGRATELMTGVLDEVREHSTLVLFLSGALCPLYIPDGTTNPLELFQSLLGEPGSLILGACGQAEYRRREFSPVLDRLIYPVPVDEPSADEVLAVLRNARERLEKHHQVDITDEALAAAASLARDHVPDQLLPGAALDLLDEASAQARVRAARSDGSAERIDWNSALLITKSDVVTALAVYSGTQSPAGPSRHAAAHRITPVEHDPYIWSMS